MVQRKVKSGGSRGRRERKPRTQETEMADDANDEGASEWTHKRNKIAAQTFDLIQEQLTNSFTSTFTDADQNPFHTIWYYI